jgi:CRISPR/Cas system-associated exonuclease Cas4 (RecB family)
MDRVALLLGGSIEERLEKRVARLEQTVAQGGTKGVQGKETAGVLPLECQPQTQSAADLGLNMEVAEVLSPSQVNNYLNCSASWYFKYFRNLPDKTDAKRALGKAVHAAIEQNFRQKIETKKDLGREELLEAFALAWRKEAEQAQFAEGDDQAELERAGSILVQKYLIEAAPEITPIAVEHPVSGVIAGVKVRGYVDLMDSNGKIIDLKTSSKKPSEISPDHKRQLTTYTRIMPGASGKTTTQTLVRTKTPQLIEQNHTVGPEDIRHIETLYPLVQEAMRSGLYIPNRNFMFCSRKSCSFWKACQQEYGGEVAES